MVLPTLAILVMKRRAGMVALDAGLILLCIVLLKDNFRLFLIAVPIAILGGGALLALTWNEPGGRGQFARSFQTVTDTGPQAEEDRSSNDYRGSEDFNVRFNIKQQPLVGLGFGQEYTFILPVADFAHEWPLWRFVPHNSVMWIWMKAGALAFIALLTLFAAAMCRGMQLWTRLEGDRMKPVAFSLSAMVLMFVLFSYVDLGLVSPRALVFFGAVLGLIGALTVVVAREDEQAATGAVHGHASS
jgi:O-antigen ligase